MLELLANHPPMTQRELEDEADVNYKAFTKAITALMAEFKVRIGGHKLNGCIYAPRYTLGDSRVKRHAKRPTPMTDAEAAKRYRARHKSRLRAKRMPKVGMWAGLL